MDQFFRIVKLGTGMVLLSEVIETYVCFLLSPNIHYEHGWLLLAAFYERVEFAFTNCMQTVSSRIHLKPI